MTLAAVPGCKSLADLHSLTRGAIDMYLLSKQQSGHVGGIGYWQIANGYTAIALHDLWSRSRHYQGLVEDALMKIESAQPTFVNEFNDDTMWWAICSVTAYKAYGNEIHLARARQIQRHVSGSVVRKGQCTVRGMDMEGAVFWTTKHHEQNLNSITTGLYAELCAELANSSDPEIGAPNLESQHLKSDHQGIWKSFQARFKDIPTSSSPTPDSYVNEAARSLDWIERCRLSNGIVLDTIKVRDHEFVDWMFTYNTGQTIGACVALVNARHGDSSLQGKYLELACYLARTCMKYSHWNINGVLAELNAYGPTNHDPFQNDDAVGFKSILVRHLARLFDCIGRIPSPSGFVKDTPELIRDYVNKIFVSLRQENVNDVHQYGPWWGKCCRFLYFNPLRI